MARLTSTADLRRIISEPRPDDPRQDPRRARRAVDRLPEALPLRPGRHDRRRRHHRGLAQGRRAGLHPGRGSKTLLIPERVGNNLAFGLSNILATGKIGLIALVPATGETLRVSGTAEIFDDADLVASLSSLGKPALLATRVHIQHCYFHCARSIVRAKLWDPKAWPAPGRVSFGKIIAPRIGADASMAAQIDAGVEGAYTTRLWTNS